MFRLTKNLKFVQKWGRGTPNGQLNMVSYNLTTQNNIENTYNSPINSLLSNAKPVHKTWDHRKQLHSENLYNLAQGDGVDIFCLQEVDDDHLMEVYQPLFTSLGYKVLYAKNRGSTRKQDNYGVAIAFNKSKIEMTKQHTVQFYKDQEFREFQGQLRSTGDSGPLGLKLKSPEVALLANLQYKGHKDKKFIVANTQLIQNCHRGDVKLAQALIFMHNVQSLSMATKTPVLMAGDFGAAEGSDLMKFVGDGYVKYFNKKSSEFSGQVKTHASTRKMQVPPILEECSIDYRTCGSWQQQAEVGSRLHNDRYMKDFHGIDLSVHRSKDAINANAEANQELRTAQGKKGGMINSKTLQGLNSLNAVQSEIDTSNKNTGGDGGIEAEKEFIRKGGNNVNMVGMMGGNDDTAMNYRRYGDGDKRFEWDYRQEQQLKNPFDAGVGEDVGHKMNLFNPYEGQNVYSTVYKDNKLQGDFIFVSDGVSVYDYLTLPGVEEDNALLNQDNASAHMPIGVNFSI